MDNQAKNLLDYRENELRDLFKYLNMKIIAFAKEISGGKYFDTFAMQKLIHYITTEKIDTVFVYDETRIAIYTEFKMM